MIKTILTITALLLAVLLPYRAMADEAATKSSQSKAVAAKLDKVEKETKEAEQALKDYKFAQKAELVSEMKRELALIQESLVQLTANVEKSKAVAKADANARLEAVREKWSKAKKQLDQAESADESTWEEVQLGFKNYYNELRVSFQMTRQWLSDQIKP